MSSTSVSDVKEAFLPCDKDKLLRNATSRISEFPWRESANDGAVSFFTNLARKSKMSYKRKVKEYTWLDWAAYFIPCLRWMREYKKSFLLPDIVAGLSVGFMVVPQGLSYASIAGLPSVYGLYGAFLPVLAYSLLGTSKQLAVGPVAVTSLLISTNLKPLVPGSSDITNPNVLTEAQVPIQELYNHYAIQLAFLVACLYTGVGVLRLGFVTNFLSHSVIGGFTSGAAIIIGLSQFKYIVGYPVKPKHDRIQEILAAYFDGFPNFVWQEFIMGMTLLAMMLAMKEIGKRNKKLRWLRTLGPLTSCIIGLCAVYIGKVNNMGIRVVGAIPKGLPGPTIEWWFPMDIGDLFPIAIVVMLVDLLESTSIARALAAKNKYELNANLEIVGLGLANFVGAAFNCYTTTGSFSRSSVNNESGAKSALSQFVTAWVVAFVLLFLTPVFSKLPYNVLGAIVISSVIGLFEYEQAIWLFKTNILDLVVWLASFLGTLFISVEIGLGIAVGLAVLIVVYESAFPHTAVLGRIPGTSVYRNIRQYPDAQLIPGVLVVRLDAPVYFANVQYLTNVLNKYKRRAAQLAERNGTKLQFLLLDMAPVTHLDATGCSCIVKWVGQFTKEGLQLLLCNPSAKVVSQLQRTGLVDIIGRDKIYVSVSDAMIFCQSTMMCSSEVRSTVISAAAFAVQLGDLRMSGSNSPSPSQDDDVTKSTPEGSGLPTNVTSSFAGPTVQRPHDDNRV